MRYRYRFIFFPALAGLIAVSTAPSLAEVGTQAVAKPSLVLADSGVDAAKRPVYTITAKSTEITEVLRSVFAKAGLEYAIDQDVVGPVDVNLKNRTIDEILMQIRDTARPPIKITKGEDKVYRVSRDYALEEKAAAIQNRMNNGGGFGSGQMGPAGVRGSQAVNAQLAIPSDKSVTLNIPDNRPIPLSQAIARISAQTGFSIVLDKRVPQDVQFAGSITEASLPTVLQTIADTAGLRLIVSGTQAVFVPTDHYRIMVNNMMLGQTGIACQKCRQPVWSTWSYCPSCGQATQRGIQNQMQNPYQNRQNPYLNRQQPRPGTNNPVRKIDR
jgi:hypothetical protein